MTTYINTSRLLTATIFLLPVFDGFADSDFDGNKAPPVQSFIVWVKSNSTAGSPALSASVPASLPHASSCKMIVNKRLEGKYPDLNQLCGVYSMLAEKSAGWSRGDGKPDKSALRIVVEPNPAMADENSRHVSARYALPVITIHPGGLSQESEIFGVTFHEMTHAVLTSLILHSPEFKKIKMNLFLDLSMEELLGDLLSLYITGDPGVNIRAADSRLKPEEIKYHALDSNVSVSEISDFEDKYQYLSPLHASVHRLYERDRTLDGFGRVVTVFMDQLRVLSVQYEGREITNKKICSEINASLEAALNSIDINPD